MDAPIPPDSHPLLMVAMWYLLDPSTPPVLWEVGRTWVRFIDGEYTIGADEPARFAQVRQRVVEMRASLEAAQITIEMSADKDDPAYAEAKARAIKELQRTVESVDLLAAELGGVPTPVRY